MSAVGRRAEGDGEWYDEGCVGEVNQRGDYAPHQRHPAQGIQHRQAAEGGALPAARFGESGAAVRGGGLLLRCCRHRGRLARRQLPAARNCWSKGQRSVAVWRRTSCCWLPYSAQTGARSRGADARHWAAPPSPPPPSSGCSLQLHCSPWTSWEAHWGGRAGRASNCSEPISPKRTNPSSTLLEFADNNLV